MRSPDPLRSTDSIFAQPEDDSWVNLVASKIALIAVLGLAAIACVASFQTGTGL